MATLRKAENKQKIDIPDYINPDGESEEAWVVMDISPITIGDTASIGLATSDMEAALSMLAKRIVEWNFTDDNNVPVEISAETVGYLGIEAFTYLQGKIQQVPGSLPADAKKNLSESSPQAEMIKVTVE